MDLLSLLRTLGGLGMVLGLLAGSLWLVRRYDLRLPGRTVGARDRRLELVETLPIDGRRMVALIRRDGHEHLILIAPEGHHVLESALVRDATDLAAADARFAARAEADQLRLDQRQHNRQLQAAAPAMAAESFAVLVDRVRTRSGPVTGALQQVVQRAARSVGAATRWRGAIAPQDAPPCEDVPATGSPCAPDPAPATQAPREPSTPGEGAPHSRARNRTRNRSETHVA